MITNSSLTIYHKGFNAEKHEETWTRFNYDNVWWFGGKGASLDKGINEANDLDVRILYNEDLDVNNFALGDILVKGKLTLDITTQTDLSEYDIYHITMIKDNNFGGTPHIHIGGK